MATKDAIKALQLLLLNDNNTQDIDPKDSRDSFDLVLDNQLGLIQDELAAVPLTNTYIADSAITTSKHADLSVTVDKLATSSVSAAKIQAAAVQTASVKDLNITLPKLSQAVQDLLLAVGGGTITNNPDDEDLESVASVLKFKDRTASGNQKGYKIIRQNFDFTNIPASYANSIWEIRYEHDLGGSNINLKTQNIPNVTLRFNGGVLANYGIITGNNTLIESDKVKIFDASGELTDFGVNIIYPEWFGAVGDFSYSTQLGTDNSNAFQKAANVFSNGGTISASKGFYFFSSGFYLKKGTILRGSGRVNFNGYAGITPLIGSGGTALVIDDAVTLLSFNKESNVTAFGCEIRDISFTSKVISESPYNDAPVYPVNTNAINLTHTAELVMDNVDFSNIDTCMFNIDNELAVKPIISRITSKDVNFTFLLNNTAADFTIDKASCIKSNFFIKSKSVDGISLSNSTIYRSKNSAIFDEAGSVSNFLMLSNCKFFESGDDLVFIDGCSQLSMTNCQLVRAGLVGSAAKRALVVVNSETINIQGGFIERPLGDGIFFNNNRSVTCNIPVYRYGWTQGGGVGIKASGNDLMNLNMSISGVGENSWAAAEIESNIHYGGTIITDDIIRGEKDNIVEYGDNLVEYTNGSSLVIGNGGNEDIELNIPYTLKQGQRVVIYEIDFTPGGDNVGMSGLVFRVDSDFTTILDGTGFMELRKYPDTNPYPNPDKSGIFDVRLYNGTGSTFTVPANSKIDFKWKVVTYTKPEF